MLLFSIIIPVYNVEKYLSFCVQSVLFQTYHNFEIVLVDDGSTDNSGFLCDQLAREDFRIKIIHKKNGGLSDARNAGLKFTTGNYVLFLDSDDYWVSDTVLENLARRIHITDPDVLIYNLQKDFGGVLTAPYFPESIQIPAEANTECAEQLVFENRLWTACAWNKVIRRELFDQYDLYFRVGVTSEDVDWCCRLALCAKRMDFLNINVVGYRQRRSSITGSGSATKTQCLLDNIQLCLFLIDSTPRIKRQHLLSYLAYQYCTLLHGYALLPLSEKKKHMRPQISQMQYLLEYSDDPKVNLIRRVKKLAGLGVTLKLLAARARIEAWRNKRSD